MVDGGNYDDDVLEIDQWVGSLKRIPEDVSHYMGNPVHPGRISRISNGRNYDDDVLEIDQWVSSLERILEDVPHYMCDPGHPGRISRIPENLRDVDRKAYEPYLMSIGPYHHGKSRLQQLEKKKLVALKSFMELKPKLELTDFLKEMMSIEPSVRGFYPDVEMESEQFVQMLLLDSLYILLALCGMAKGREKTNYTNEMSGNSVNNEDTNERENQKTEGTMTGDDKENTQAMAKIDESKDGRVGQGIAVNWFWPLFLHDLFLLENQLPLFVLHKIHALAYGGHEPQLMKAEVANMLCRYRKLDSVMVSSPTEEVHHLMHLCHLFFRPTLPFESTTSQLYESNQMFWLGSAVQLYESGVNFEVASDSTQRTLLDITFGSYGKMVIPCLHG